MGAKPAYDKTTFEAYSKECASGAWDTDPSDTMLESERERIEDELLVTYVADDRDTRHTLHEIAKKMAQIVVDLDGMRLRNEDTNDSRLIRTLANIEA